MQRVAAAVLCFCVVPAFSTSAESNKCSDGSISDTMSYMRIKRTIPAPRPHWVGDGFHVYPVFGSKAFTKHVSPFLMFDYGAPRKSEPTQRRLGVGQHPHRGFETVTIAFQGEVEHADSVGNRGVIGPGDIQWMTAARGIIHEEFHSRDFARKGGILEMCQLWVNLPKKHKMDPPKYQAILKDQIPEVPLYADDDSSTQVGTVRIIAGSWNGTKGPASTHTAINLWDVTLKDSRAATLTLGEGHNTMVFARRGHIVVEGDTIEPQGVATMEIGGSKLRISAKDVAEPASALILSGEPIQEPIAARGPFVMNTHEELMTAMRDYQSGKMGR